MPSYLDKQSWDTVSKAKPPQGGAVLGNSLAAYAKASANERLACLEKVRTDAELVKKKLSPAELAKKKLSANASNPKDKNIIDYLEDLLQEATQEIKKAGGGDKPDISGDKAAINGTESAPANEAANAPADAAPDAAPDATADGEDEKPDAQAARLQRLVESVLARKPKTPLSFAGYLTPKVGAVMFGNVAQAGSLLPKVAGVPGGQRVTGDYVWERERHTFIVETVTPGLAKRLSAALLFQTGNPYKVTVRTHGRDYVVDSDEDLEADDYEAKARELLKELPAGDKKGQFIQLVALAIKKADLGTWVKVMGALEPAVKAARAGAGQPTAAEPAQARQAAEAQRREQERLAAEKQEQELQAAERKANEERLAAEAKAREETERKAKEEQELLAAERRAKEEADRKAKEEAERKANEERQAAEAKAERERLAAEQAEQDRLAAEKKAREEQERQAAEKKARAEQAERERLAAEKKAQDRLAALEARARELLAKLPDSPRKPRLVQAVEMAATQADEGVWNKVLMTLQSLAGEADRQRQAAQVQPPAQPRPAAQAPKFGPTVSADKLTPVLTSALRDEEQYTLNALPNEDAERIVDVLKLLKKDLTAADAINDPNAKQAAMRKTRQADIFLRGALRSNAVFKPHVDPDKVDGLSDDQKKNRRELAAKRRAAANFVLRSFRDHPALAASALDIIQDAEHPETVASAVAAVGALQDSRFGGKAGDAGRAARMATNVLKLAGTVGGNDFAARLTAYYEPDALKRADTLRAAHDEDPKITALNYTKALGESLLVGNGGIAFNSEGFREVRDQLHFHPDRLQEPMFNLARHVEVFTGNLANAEARGQCEAALRGIPNAAPNKKVARLVKQTLRLPDAAPLDAKAMRQAVLSAALTPITQGSVGSCFATCNCMQYQENEPVAFFKDLATVAGTGTLTKGGDPAPVVKTVAKDENGLLRGLEYTIASLGARTHASVRKENMQVRSYNALIDVMNSSEFEGMSGGTKAALDAGRRAEQVEAEAFAAYQTYGSTPGVTQEQADAKYDEYLEKVEATKNAREEVETYRAEKLQRMADTVRNAVAYEYDSTLQDGTGSHDGSSDRGGWMFRSTATGKRIRSEDDLVDSLKQAFIQELGDDANEANIEDVIRSANLAGEVLEGYKLDVARERYVRGGGSDEKDSLRVLSGREVETKDLTTPRANNETPADQAKKLLVGLVDGTKETATEKVTVSIDGVHAERGLAKHASLDALKASGNVAKAVDDVFKKSQERATTALKPEEVQLLLLKSTNTVLTELFQGHVPTLPPGLMSGKLTPAALKASIESSITAQDLQQHGRYVDPAATRRRLSNELEALFVAELFPQFVIADTNWGSASEKYYHVVAPDLATGAPKLYRKDGSTGQLEPAGDAFIQNKWDVSTPKW